MIRIFFKNLLRNLLTILVVTVITVILTFVIVGVTECSGDLVMSLRGKDTPFDLAPTIVLIIDAVIAAIISFCWFSVASVSGEWFFTGSNDNVKRPPFILFGILMLAIVPTVLCFFGVQFMISGYDRMIAGIEAASHAESPFSWSLFFFLFLPALTVSQVMFFFAMLLHYKNWQLCTHCWRMFCFDYHYTGCDKQDDVQYKTKTSREKLGTVSVGNRKIDVEADVTRGHYETTTTLRNKYAAKCTRCGAEKVNASTETHFH